MAEAVSDGRKSLFAERSLWMAVVLWIAAIAAIFPLSEGPPSQGPLTHGLHGSLPFNRPVLANVPFAAQVMVQAVSPLPPLVLMVVTYFLTRRRAVPDISARAPVAPVALRETLLLWLYGAAVLTVGQVIGRRLFGEGIGLHLNGSLFGATRVQSPAEVWTWAAYNFVFYAVVPYLFFRMRGYSHEALNLKSSNVANDTLVIVVVLALEAGLELAGRGLFALNGRQMLMGGLLSFVAHLFGTGLPVMVFIYAILFPRYLRLTGSAVTTVLLGALSYAALHIFEYWTVYDSPAHAALSVIFAVTTFFGPGLIKSYLTLRTGNAWVHLWAYHAIAPHVTSDAPVVVKIFGIR